MIQAVVRLASWNFYWYFLIYFYLLWGRCQWYNNVDFENALWGTLQKMGAKKSKCWRTGKRAKKHSLLDVTTSAFIRFLNKTAIVIHNRWGFTGPHPQLRSSGQRNGFCGRQVHFSSVVWPLVSGRYSTKYLHAGVYTNNPCENQRVIAKETRVEKGDLSGRKSSGELDGMREDGEYDQNALHPCMKLPNNTF